MATQRLFPHTLRSINTPRLSQASTQTSVRAVTTGTKAESDTPGVLQSLDDADSPKAGAYYPAIESPATPSLRGLKPPLGSPGRCRTPDGVGIDSGSMTCTEATFTLVNFLINVGQFTLPLTFARHGWAAGLLMMLGAFICTQTALMLSDALVQLMRRGVPLPDFPELAVHAVGPGFAMLAHFCSLGELLTYNICNLIGLGKGVVGIFPSLTPEGAMALCMGICVGLSAVPDRVFAYLAMTAAIAVMAVEATSAIGGLELPEWEQPTTFFDNAWQIPSSFAVVIFSAGTHPLLPCLMHNTRTRHEFRTCVLTGWSTFVLISTGFGGVFYYMYGSTIQPMITENTGRDLSLKTFPGGRALQRVSGIWVCVKLLFSIIPVTRPVCQSVARRIGFSLPAGNGGWRSVMLTAPLLVVILTCSIFAQHYVEAFESAVGAILIGFNALVFPSVTYLMLCKPRGWTQRLGAWSTFCLGLALPAFVLVLG